MHISQYPRAGQLRSLLCTSFLLRQGTLWLHDYNLIVILNTQSETERVVMCRVTCGRATYSASTRASLTMINSDIRTFSCIWSKPKGPRLQSPAQSLWYHRQQCSQPTQSSCLSLLSLSNNPPHPWHLFSSLSSATAVFRLPWRTNCFPFSCVCQSLLFSFILCFYSRIGLMTCYDFSIVCQVYTSRWLCRGGAIGVLVFWNNLEKWCLS